MGVFDSNQSNKKYNDAKPNFDVDDGVDIETCTDNCKFRDEERNRCVFETCIFKQFPFSIPYHDTVTKTCESCGEKFTVNFDDTVHPYTRLVFCLCDKCMNNLTKLASSDFLKQIIEGIDGND